jgi:hypothetical protein
MKIWRVVMPQKKKLIILAESPKKSLNEALFDGRVSFGLEYEKKNPKQFDSHGSVIDWYNNKDRAYDSLPLKKKLSYAKYDSSSKRDYTFSQQADYFKIMNKDIDVDVKPFYGKQELEKVMHEASLSHKGENVSVSIMGHAGNKMGGVSVDDYKDIVDKSGFSTSCSVDEVLMGSCNYSGREKNSKSISDAFSADVISQWGTWGIANRTEKDIESLRNAGAGEIGSRLLVPNSDITTTKYKSDAEVALEEFLGSFSDTRQPARSATTNTRRGLAETLSTPNI